MFARLADPTPYFTNYWRRDGDVADILGSQGLQSNAAIPGVNDTPDGSFGPLNFEHFMDPEPGLAGYWNGYTATQLIPTTPGGLVITGDFALNVIVKLAVSTRCFCVRGQGNTWGAYFMSIPGTFFSYPRVQYFNGIDYPVYDFTDAAFAMGQPANVLLRRVGTTLKCRLNKWDAADITGVDLAVDDGNLLTTYWEYIYADIEPFMNSAEVGVLDGTMDDAAAATVTAAYCQFARA